ncbi:MAG: glycosyl transferase [Acaryochloris sp. RU_4_1]|nr:glycosyl transferase [Acaryochloris sp. RU_4_1]NJR53217.1 glycosyl transferase [Acaryochloris sp. CRU_2_0]
MITVTLGTSPFPFDRVILWLDHLLKTGIIDEPMFVQYGASNVAALRSNPLVESVAMLNFDILMDKVKQSRLTISHAGQGSTRTLIKRGAAFVLLPRLATYGEHIDNHQLTFAQTVAQWGVTYCISLAELEQVVTHVPLPLSESTLEGPQLVDHLCKVYPR